MASEIIASLPQKYEAALKSGDLLFFPSSITRHTEFDIDFEVRVCPAIREKTKAQNKASFNAPGQSDLEKHDPFAPPYNHNLHIGNIRDEETGNNYVVLLNKYSVVPQHFILATKESRSQSSPLTPTDLVTIFRILLAAKRTGRNFFAFYNCGENSGASQPHKHVQFFPLVEGTPPPVERLAIATSIETLEKPFSLSRVLHANYIRRFPTDISFYDYERLETALSRAFLQLMDLMIMAVRHDTDYPAGKLSYNVWMTPKHLHLIPRRHGMHRLNDEIIVNVNALGFAGILLVKDENELEAVKNEGIGNVLLGVGLVSTHEEHLGTAAEVIDEVSMPLKGSIL